MTTDPLSKKPDDWSWKDGIGSLPFGNRRVAYDEAYFRKYVCYADTQLGHDLTEARVAMLDLAVDFDSCLHSQDVYLDVGIGSGDYVLALRRRGLTCYGEDINPVALAWLTQQGFRLPEITPPIAALSMWDVLEHIEDPRQDIFDRYKPEQVLISMPIYRNEEHVFQSKHYRPGEHCWYFTADGLKRFMDQHGYACTCESDEETKLGREDIGSFIFRKI